MTATAFVDAVGFNPASSGTGDFVVSAAITGYQTPASAGAVNAAVYSYRAQSSDLTQWEIGYGTYTTGTTTLARTTVLASSTGSKVSFTAAPNVFVTALTADLQNASLLTSGTVPTGVLGSGTANAGKLLQGDNTWAQQGRKLLNPTTTTAMSDTTSFATGATLGYTEFEILLEGIINTSASQSLSMQVQSGGSFQTTSYLGAILWGGSSGSSGTSLTTGMLIGAPTISATALPGMSARIWVSNPAGTSGPKVFYGTWFHSTGSQYLSGTVGGYWNSSAAITGIQLIESSGTPSGVMKIYGLS